MTQAKINDLQAFLVIAREQSFTKASLTTNQSASLAVHGEVKRGHRYMEPKAPLTGGEETPTARSEFFTDRSLNATHP